MPASRTSSTNTASEDVPSSDLVPKPKRTVIRATPSQLAELTQLFAVTPRPTVDARNALAVRTGLTTEWISGWFMRERRRAPIQSSNNITVSGVTESPDQSPVSENRVATVFRNDADHFSTNSSSAASQLPENLQLINWSATPSASSSVSSLDSAPTAAAPPPLKLSISTAHLMNRDSVKNHLRFLGSSHALQTMQTPNRSLVSTAPIMPIATTTENHLSRIASYLHTPPPRPQPPKPCFRTRFRIPRKLTGETRDAVKVAKDAASNIIHGNVAEAQDSETEEEATPYLGRTDPSDIPPPSYYSVLPEKSLADEDMC